MTTYSTTHDGLERVLEGTDVLVHSVGPARGMRLAPTLVLTGVVTAVLAIAVRVFDDLLTDGFTREWLALWLLATATVYVFGKMAVSVGNWLTREEHGLVARWKAAEADRAFYEVAERDPRVMADLRAAALRAEWE